MAGRNRASFLKRQKEDQRRSRAAKKREERQLRKQARASDETPIEPVYEGSEPVGEGEDEPK